jgi:hypothetical protein
VRHCRTIPQLELPLRSIISDDLEVTAVDEMVGMHHKTHDLQSVQFRCLLQKVCLLMVN